MGVGLCRRSRAVGMRTDALRCRSHGEQGKWSGLWTLAGTSEMQNNALKLHAVCDL